MSKGTVLQGAGAVDHGLGFGEHDGPIRDRGFGHIGALPLQGGEAAAGCVDVAPDADDHMTVSRQPGGYI
ncbi:hypothetical protein V5F76_10345 [Xanthobacter agilis]|uniref:Uncharacterized protein n=1 Tax=Xanthobacter agilis TaxID=47492 RepID=A0ABU0LIP4_XANAG|nr:hypothetical protein [Xanthobacter agilis]MDQ0507009.1 hypothetical protein [Xanthobacter agilis]